MSGDWASIVYGNDVLDMCHYYFDSLENSMDVFARHAEELQGDIKNYTNIEPIVQINEVQISKQSS
ncbi:MAG: hypothetical protein P8163_21200 [Candidatus Thiodiazotropha sp.]|jgi:uncharacterized protein (TIGR02118 family)